ncbi:alpha/beta hydrolase [Sphingomonas sp. ID0503]|uniref:alpha/beta hydrolase n=1 Tax=Sphingomonas sp. ID0503 TaxID=3399691 RepID=UPI003AFAAB07
MNPRRVIPAGMSFGNWTAPDGWRMRRFDWPADGARGNILFLGGRGDFVEKYLEPLAHWHQAGWGLTGFDWRGQGGSGRMLADPMICHAADFDALLADLRAFVALWAAETKGPHVIVANSMGGHLVMRLLAEGTAVDGVVLTAPMVGIRVRGLSNCALGRIAGAAVRLGLGERLIWRRDAGDVGGRMTSCPDRQADKLWWKAEHPEIASGGPSWGWTRAACASIGRLSDGDYRRITTPALILASERDVIVDVRAIARAAALMPAAELALFPGVGHELLREADAVRLPVMARIDRFLSSSLQGRGQ